MFCSECGSQVANLSSFCPKCGFKIGIAAVSHQQSPSNVNFREERISDVSGKSEMTFSKSLSVCLSKYAEFKGRANRPEFWWFYLFATLLSWGAILVDETKVVSAIINIALLIPITAVSTRRLHDTNRSGWRQLWYLTIIGIIPIIIWLSSDGDKSENEYG